LAKSLHHKCHRAEGFDLASQYETFALIALTLLAMTIAVTRFRCSLD
jgi:hypothetical protein